MRVSVLRTRCAEFAQASHPPARLFVGLACLGAGLGASSMVHALYLLAGMLILLYVSGTAASSIFRAFKVLAFLILPILVLHMWLTPGRLLIDFGDFGGISAEGLARGGWLSLHLALMYFAAMLFSRLIFLREWMALTAWCGGGRLQAYVIMLAPLARQVRWRMQSLARCWRRRGTWRELAPMLAAVLNQCLSVSRRQADALWLRWPDHADISAFLSPTAASVRAWPATLVLLLIGTGIIAMAVSR